MPWRSRQVTGSIPSKKTQKHCHSNGSVLLHSFPFSPCPRDSFFSCTSGNRGYSGTATFVRSDRALPFASEDGFTGCTYATGSQQAPGVMAPHEELAARFSVEELQELDAEGRVVVTDHGAFVLFNLYGPAITTNDSEAAAARFDFKLRFYAALQARWDELARRGRAVIVVGDLNICAAPLDTCEPKSVRRRACERQ